MLTYMPSRVLDSTGNGYISDIIEGIDWAVKNNMDILNMSFGTTKDSQSLHDAIIKPSQAGITMADPHWVGEEIQQKNYNN